MKFNYVILIVSISIGLGCCKNNEFDDSETNSSGEVQYISPIWTKSYIENQNWQDAPPSIFGNWSFIDKVLTNFRKNDNTIALQCLNPIDGEICWEWADWYNPETEQTNGTFTFLKDNILHWKTGTRQYWIDISNGTTVKRFNGDQSFTKNMDVLGNQYFWIGAEYDTYPNFQLMSIFQGDFYDVSPSKRSLINMDTTMSYSNRLGGVNRAVPYFDGQDTLLIVVWQKLFPPGWNVQSYLGLYNLNTEEWIYNDVPVYDIHQWGNATHIKVYENTIIMNIHTSIICFDFANGIKMWEKEFAHNFKFSGFEISEDILVANCEDKNLYGIDPNTGQILWTGEGAGTSSLLQDRIMDGVVYFKGGSSGNFHAVDIHTGETLWKLDPYLYEDNNAYWSGGDVHVIKPQLSEKGYVVINNALNTYCFEAAK